MSEGANLAEAPMRPYTTERYIRLVENIADAELQYYMKAETDFLRGVRQATDRTFVDLGAGYGRLLPPLAAVARNTVGIELNPDMLGELRARAARLPDATAIEGDIQELPSLLEGLDLVRPVLMLLQNTLGTIEGDQSQVLAAMKAVGKRHRGDVVLSLFRQGALADWGIEMYRKISEMVGDPDLERTNPARGLFVSESGYRSKWWTDVEIEALKAFFGGWVARELVEPTFVIVQIEVGRREAPGERPGADGGMRPGEAGS